MALNQSISKVGVSLQTRRGDDQSSPKFSHGVTGGSVFKGERSVENAKVACGLRAGTDAYVDTVAVGNDFETYGYDSPLPLYLYAAMGQIKSEKYTSAGEGYFKHTIKLGNTIPYLTFFGMLGGNDCQIVRDSKLDKLELEFAGNSPLSVGITAMGCRNQLKQSWDEGVSDNSVGYFVPTDGIYKFAAVGTNPLECNVMSGSLSLSNSCAEFRPAGKVAPADVSEGKLVASGKVEVHIDDLAPYYEVMTGKKSGTEIASAITYGSLEWSFKHSADPKMSMTIKAMRVPFNADFPEADPDGNGVDMEFSFEDLYLQGSNDSPIEIVIVNKTEKYTD